MAKNQTNPPIDLSLYKYNDPVRIIHRRLRAIRIKELQEENKYVKKPPLQKCSPPKAADCSLNHGGKIYRRKGPSPEQVARIANGYPKENWWMR